jgi:hypothetical protein
MSTNLVKTCCLPPHCLIDIFEECKSIKIRHWKRMISFVEQHTKLRLTRDGPDKGWVVQKPVTRLVNCTENRIWVSLLRHKLIKIVWNESLHIWCTTHRSPVPFKNWLAYLYYGIKTTRIFSILLLVQREVSLSLDFQYHFYQNLASKKVR